MANLPVHDTGETPASSRDAREALSSWAIASHDVLGVIANAPASMNGLADGSQTFLAQTGLSPRVRAEVALMVAEVTQARSLAIFHQRRLSAIHSESVTDGDADMDTDSLLALVRQVIGGVTDARDELAAALASGWNASDVVDALRVAADVLWMTWLAHTSGLEAP